MDNKLNKVLGRDEEGLIRIEGCARCGSTHVIVAKPFPVDRGIDMATHYTTCPTTGAPVLISFFDTSEIVCRVAARCAEIAAFPDPGGYYNQPVSEERRQGFIEGGDAIADAIKAEFGIKEKQ